MVRRAIHHKNKISETQRISADVIQDLQSESDRPKRCILMLQGHPSGFWALLHDGLKEDGHRVLKVHFCLADAVFWGARPAVSYRGRYSKWRDWISQYMIAEQVTDVFYYADRLPYHVDALNTAKAIGVRCWAIEFGYLRPDWITMEPDGMGAASTFPKNREDIEAMADAAEAPDMRVLYPHTFPKEAFGEVTYHLLQAYGRPFYPLYFSDKIYWPAIDYLSWILELLRERPRQALAREIQALAESGGIDYNLVAMQIQADYQIRASSPYGHISEFLAEVFASFARSAPPSRELVIKLHPLDNGLERWFSRVPRLARQAGLEGRVHLIKGGDLAVLLRKSKGVVLINSTVGIHALRFGVPTYAAGDAIFDLDGLTHQGSLDAFWSSPERVEPDFFTQFQSALTSIQIKGSFFNPEGRKAAISAIRQRMMNRPSAVVDDETAMT